MATATKVRKVKEEEKDLSNPTYQKIKKRALAFIESIPERLEQRRVFRVGSIPHERILCVIAPTPKIIAESSKSKSKFYSDLLREENGLMLEKELLNIMIERSVWSEEKNKRLEDLKQRMDRLSTKLFTYAEEKMTKEEFDSYCEDYDNCEKEFDKLIQEKNHILEDSVEAKTSEFSIKDQMWRSVYEIKSFVDEADENKVKPLLDENREEQKEFVWNSFEKVDNERDRILLARCLNEFITFTNSVPSNFLE
jgi:hypothetical protein